MHTHLMTQIVACVSLALLLTTSCKTSKPTAQQEPRSEATVTVFEPSTGYATTRIPALVCTTKGTLLAFCEGRVQSASDWADMDMLERRSTDGGNTWSAPIVVAARQTKTPTSNCTPIVDRDGKTIHLLYQRNYSKAYYIKSTDDGQTWSQPRDITATFDQFKSEYDLKVLAPGPGHAIQLAQKGPHQGRLVVPVWLCKPDPTIPGGDHRPSCIATIYSDDAGKTWQRGAIIANNSAEIKNPSEHVAVELTDGRVMLNIRTESAPHRRMVAYSPDGATNWTKPVFDDELFDPICMASLVRIPATKNQPPALLFVNPDSEANPAVLSKRNDSRKRENLTAKLSFDEGKTWPLKQVLDEGSAGYSDLAVGADGTIYCLYETNQGASEGWRYRVVLKRFNRAWLQQGQVGMHLTK